MNQTNQTVVLLRLMFLAASAAAGWHISIIHDEWTIRPWMGCFLGMALGLSVILADIFAKGISLRAFSSAIFGLTLGLVFATLVSASGLFRYADASTQWVIQLVLYLSLGYMGTMLALRSNKDELSLIIPYIRFMRQEPLDSISILDTSAIIDGRVKDLCKSGFLGGTLIVPSFVLQELQNMADHSDPHRRAKGRHGLDLLKELGTLPLVNIKVHEATDSPDPVDLRLIQLAQAIHAHVVTTDYNLARVAELRKVRALNIHLLAGILRSPVTSGEMIQVQLVKEGKESHQAVGYLQDGTMIVVNYARSQIGQTVQATISSTIQTQAGRMVFAELANPSATH